MPGGDRTGPLGMGAMTGRAAGFCAGQNRAGYTNAGYGRGFGAGMGRAWGGGGAGRGFRRFGNAYRPWWSLRGEPEPTQTSATVPDRQVEALQAELDQLRNRLNALEAK
jgi:hypothetical protein